MKITLIQLGKTEDSYLIEGIDKYEKRLKHYINFNIITIPALKNTKHFSAEEQKKKESDLIFKHLIPSDHVVLLDERGKDFSSVQFADQLNKYMNRAVQNLVFIIGGPYGFDKTVYERANEKISLSKMTFSHQMVRLFFVEQIYRAYTILKGEPYHHE
ncbi:23S rRNA (pseudouridine(1915)-N(3))-methyltransferase RlmH [Solitalea lacus]|uniref:23S rRNA (pseudouridine(1915)-N(3))-methyltransferase RlmH n=1 Tax=Solitalea lacus TaxID=2911172 RepID=UPI001ED9FA14|nr:23S rRNA (pseudouridine(1915)-N(3))-methyltransferase RlmH [Solitalea lacus]UKJ07048.1 23S rRNA (pseudouridine(1915)-N(3))-methyltransferase RlmH [Solitalea lacus]